MGTFLYAPIFLRYSGPNADITRFIGEKNKKYIINNNQNYHFYIKI